MGYVLELIKVIDKTITENLHFIEDKNKKYYAMLLLKKVNKEII